MNTPMRLALSTSAFLYTMDRSLLESAFSVQSTGPVVLVSKEINDKMCGFLREVAEAVNHNPVDAIELYFSPTLDRLQMADVLRRNLQKQVWSVHGPYGRYLDVSSPDLLAKQSVVSGYREAIMFARDLDAKIVVVHPGYKTVYEAPRMQRLECSIEGIKKIADIAGECGIHLGIEPMPNDEIGCSMDEIDHILQQVGRENVGINFDTNHLYPAGRIPSYIEKAGSRIRSIHISDQEDAERHWLPFMGKLNWADVLQALADTGYAGPLVYETHIRNAESIEDVVEIICNNYRKLSRLIPESVHRQ